MDSPYDYIQIVNADDWGLVAIIPNNGAGDRAKKMASELNANNEQIQPQKIVTNKRRPITRMIVQEQPPVTQQTKSAKLETPHVYDGAIKSISFGNLASAKTRDNVLVGFRY